MQQELDRRVDAAMSRPASAFDQAAGAQLWLPINVSNLYSYISSNKTASAQSVRTCKPVLIS
eukprot:1161341-Pelagomonas_calceolata.AAC.1